jgi:bifunctional non-homologous end joining protein LigD
VAHSDSHSRNPPGRQPQGLKRWNRALERVAAGYAGRVGSGFSERALAELYNGLRTIRRARCPFVNLPEKRPGRWGLGITSSVMKRCEWVEPVLVAEVKFTEWTSDDQLRQPVFLGLRTDKQAKDVVREAG